MRRRTLLARVAGAPEPQPEPQPEPGAAGLRQIWSYVAFSIKAAGRFMTTYWLSPLVFMPITCVAFWICAVLLSLTVSEQFRTFHLCCPAPSPASC